MVRSYYTGQCKYRIFPSTQNVLVGSADGDNKKLSLYFKAGESQDHISVFLKETGNYGENEVKG